MAASSSGVRYGALLFVLVLALLSWWFQRQERSQEAGGPRDSHVVDYSMKDFEVTVMDKQGRPMRRLEALSMRHFADDDSAELEQPHLLLYRTPGERWSLVAERAQLYHGGSLALLQGVVTMKRLDGPELELETRDLWLHPDQEFAESGEAVEIRERHGVTRAQGLRIDLKAGQLELLAAVRGEYVRD